MLLVKLHARNVITKQRLKVSLKPAWIVFFMVAIYTYLSMVCHLHFFIAKARGGTCTTASSDPTEAVLCRASFLLKKGFGGYHLFKNNCEDFAMYCKTGLLLVRTSIMSVGQSGQATSLLAAVGTVVSSPFVFMSTSLCGLALV